MKTAEIISLGSRSPNNFDVLVGARLRKLRTESNLTLQQLADQIGVSQPQLQKYEVGTNRISAGKLPAFAEALGIDILDFFKDEDSAGSPKTTSADKLRRECETLLRLTKSEDVLRKMSRVLKALHS